MVGRPHGVLVMLDHNHSVSLIAQMRQCSDQAVIIAWVKTNRGFIEDVEDTDQSATYLGREPNTLTFATTKRRCCSVEGQIVESNVYKKSKTTPNLFHGLPRDRLLNLIQSKGIKKVACLPNRQPAHLGKIL